jgi:hypothetical protein
MRYIALIIMASMMFVGLSSLARADWYVNGERVSNVCSGNESGVVFVYPAYEARPVGSACRLPSGEWGTVI